MKPTKILHQRIPILALAIIVLFFSSTTYSQELQESLSLDPTSIKTWKKSGDGSFELKKNEVPSGLKGDAPEFRLYWTSHDGTSPGILSSQPFRITHPLQLFDIAGMSGINPDGSHESFLVRLKSVKTGKTLREISTNGYPFISTEYWRIPELIGQNVYLEVYAPVLRNFWGTSDVWIAFENYRQEDISVEGETEKTPLYGLNIDENASINYCRSLPFLACDPTRRGRTIRESEGNIERIPVNAYAEALYLLGIINQGWENGVAHWGEHPETLKERQDQNYVGNHLGDIIIEYEDLSKDSIPLILGSTMWFSNHWSHGASHEVAVACREPFESRPAYMKLLRENLKVREDEHNSSFASDYSHFYLAVKPRDKKINALTIRDDEGTRGRPLISGVTLKSGRQKGLYNFGTLKVAREDLEPAIDVTSPPDYQRDAAKIAEILYTHDHDLPEDPSPIELPENLDATSIRFLGGKEARWLSNIWSANLAQIHEKFDPETGYFRETGEDCPWYGGYSGLGTWCTQGVYPAAYSRTSDHFVTLALRHINNSQRETSFVDFCDKWLYFYRNNRDPKQGPPNDKLDISRYPADAPPHWSMELSNPPTADGLININEIFGDEEMDGHASTIIARWYAWKFQGGNAGEWLRQKREDIYGKSRWDSNRDATEFICWLMDYTGRDLVYSEGEFTGWGGIGNGYCLVPKNMSKETDPGKIRENYANANMYEPYPNFACMTALYCAAEMADTAGEKQYAEKWRYYAGRIREGMLRQLIAGDFNYLTWRISPYSVLTTFQDRLVQAWFSLYREGLDTKKWDQEMLKITHNTFHDHMKMPYGHSPALAMGYGQGWLTHSSLILDEMDHAGKLLVNTAKYSYDKNMDYQDEQGNIDWRKWAWIVPEGANILPDGSWHRINDLSNGANQGPVMHAIEACAGVDDSRPEKILIMPRIPEPLDGIEVENHLVMIRGDQKLVRNYLNYQYMKEGTFQLNAEKLIPDLSVRLGPWDNPGEAEKVLNHIKKQGYKVRKESCGTYHEKTAWWIWVENLKDVRNIEIDFSDSAS